MLRAFFFSTVLLLSIGSPALAGADIATTSPRCRERQTDPKTRLDGLRAGDRRRTGDRQRILGFRVRPCAATRLLEKRDYDKAIAAFTDGASRPIPTMSGYIDAPRHRL